MKCIIVGSGRFIAPKLIEELVYAKHEVALLDAVRPPASVASRVTHFMADKNSLGMYKEECAEFGAEVAIHLSANTQDDADQFMQVFGDQVKRTVVLSNTNVYLAHGRLKKTEPGASLAVPINEESPLRRKPIRGEGAGDKCDVEARMLQCKEPTTIIRSAPIYGPNDFLRRFYPLLVRMIDDRPFVLLGGIQSDWRNTHAYVDDVAHAIALAAMKGDKKHRIYNVGEQKTPTMKERLEHLGLVFGWDGTVKVVPDGMLPTYLQTPGDFSQDLHIDSSQIRSELGYKEPTDYYDGLAEAVGWYRENPPSSMAGKTFNYSAEDALLQEANASA